MRIISYNVNGIRAAIKKGLIDWIIEGDYDIVSIQETKATPDQVDLTRLLAHGYHPFWHSAEKKGYSGTLTLTKQEPLLVDRGIRNDLYFSEGRILRLEYENFALFNIYYPSGTSGDERQAVKMQFLDDILDYMNEYKKKQPNLIISGDYNIAHTENDIHNPVANKNTSGFKPEERAWLTEWFNSGFTDAFRSQYPEKTQYSWWSYRARSRERNKGWRIDYHSVSNNMADKIKDAYMLTDVVHSDHCPVYMEINL